MERIKRETGLMDIELDRAIVQTLRKRCCQMEEQELKQACFPRMQSSASAVGKEQSLQLKKRLRMLMAKGIIRPFVPKGASASPNPNVYELLHN
jgi:hypothetical protein